MPTGSVPFDFATSGRILFGRGRIVEIGPVAAELGRRALVVAGSCTARAERVRALLAEHGVDSSLVQVHGEPTTVDVQRGVSEARARACDLVVGIGGGSALDLGKAISALLENEGDPFDYLEVVGRGKKLARPAAPYIAIPTTAGTGSEVTRNAVLGAPQHGVKVSLRSHLMLPRIALVDSELSGSMPPRITAATGFDALVQVIEPYVCNRPSPVVDALCVDAIRRAARSLRRAYEHGDDAEARDDMALASLIGGMALANARLGAVHGFAGPIGGMFQAPHGAVCAALLGPVLFANVKAMRERACRSPSLERLDTVARILTGHASARAEDAVDWVRDLARALRIPALGAWGIGSGDVPRIVQKARAASSMQGNPIALTEQELGDVLAAALWG